MNKIYTIMIALMLVASIPLAMAATENPVLFDPWQSGNAEFECKQAGGCGDFAHKIDEWGNVTYWENDSMDGTYYNDNIAISNSSETSFNWESTYKVCAVIVKAGPVANVYYYNGANSDNGLVGPINPQSGKLYDISHVTFCFSSEENGNGGIGENGTEIPEFPAIALPIAAILGLAFFFQRRKE